MPTSSFKIQLPASSEDSSGIIEAGSNVAQTDFSPILYPEDLLSPKTYDTKDHIVPFVGFYVLLPQNARAVTDENAALDTTQTENFLQLRGLDYAAEVNKDIGIRPGDDLQQIKAAYDKAGVKIRIYRRVNLLKKFICLYMPETLNTDLNASYNNLSIGHALIKLGSVAQAIKEGVNGTLMKNMGTIMTNFIASMSEQGGLFGALGTGARYAQAGEGTAVNPLSEMFFDAMQFRQFTMDYKFIARNAKEGAAIRDIIQTFRMYMVPEIKKDDVAGLFMSVPAFFQIKYYMMKEGGFVMENENIPKISGCVLTGITVDNAPEGIAFHDDGMPVVIRMQLYFTELEIMHRDRIKQGY